MPAYSIKKAREGKHITDKELERFGVLFTICQDQIKISQAQYAQAAADYGGTAGSFQFAYRTAIKKLQANDCYCDAADDSVKTVPSKAAAKSGAKKGGAKTNKRKADSAGEVDDDEEDGKVVKKGRGGYNGEHGKIKEEAENEDEF